jgi:hypothetical protein
MRREERRRRKKAESVEAGKSGTAVVLMSGVWRASAGWALSVAHLSLLVFHLFIPKRQRILKFTPFST